MHKVAPLSATTDPLFQIPPAVFEFQAAGNNYTVIRGGQSWVAAQAACRALGLDLASFSSAAMFTEVNAQASILATNSYWIGGSDQYNGASEGTWKWPNGEIFWPGTWAPWYIGMGLVQPDGGTRENCLVVAINYGWAWNDLSCAYTDKHALCGPAGEVL